MIELEIRGQSHLMDFEGTCEEDTTIGQINTLVKSKGYYPYNTEIFYDKMMGFYRFRGDITSQL